MKPFFNYFGGKWRSSPFYPSPEHDVIIEPFAGAAGYSVRRSQGKKVLLYDKSEAVIGVWNYLIKAKVKQILALPDIKFGTKVADPIYKLCQEEKDWIGFWMNTGCVSPRKSPCAFFDPDKKPEYSDFLWGERLRRRTAKQLKNIRHWKAEVASFEDIPNQKACWFIDPPYQDHGKWYPHSNKNIDFNMLGSWCVARRGQYIVWEGAGADWLPFKPFRRIQSKKGHATELIYTNSSYYEQVSLFS